MVALGFVIALLVGLSLGLLGAGGSIVTVPLFHYVLGLETHAAITSALVVVAAVGLTSLVPHARAGRVRWRVGLLLGSASILTAFAGGRLRASLPAGVLVVAFALVMLASGLALVRPMASRTRRDAAPVRFLAIGAVVGLLTGVLGSGGGFLLVPALVIGGPLALREAVGTSLFVIVLNSVAALAGAATLAPPPLDLVIPIVAIAVAGSAIGARLGRRLSVTQLQRAFSVLVIGIALAILAVEGTTS